MKKALLFGVLVFMVLALPVCGFSETFKTSDLQGTWYTYDISVDPSMPAVYWLYGTTVMDDSGNISGSLTLPDLSTVTITDGTMALDNKGIISGGFTVSMGQTSMSATIVHGKMDRSKASAANISLGSDGSMDRTYAVKGGGTFAPDDIQRTWYLYNTVIDATSGAVFWVYGTIDVDGSGNATGSFVGADGTPSTITNGTLTLDNEGIISGSFVLDIGMTITIVHGKLDQNKSKGVFVSLEQDGSMGMAYLVRAGGIFSSSDLQGTWYTYTTQIDPVTQAVFWIYGKFRSDASGNTTGTFNTPTGVLPTGRGKMTLDNNGELTATISFPTGGTLTIVHGKQDQGHTSGFLVLSVSDPVLGNALGIGSFFKGEPQGLPHMLPLLLENQ